MRYQIRVGGRQFDVEIVEVHGGFARVSVNGMHYEVHVQGAGQPAYYAPAPIQPSAFHPVPTAYQPPVQAPTPRPAAPTAAAPKQPPTAPTKPAAASKATEGGALTAPIPGLILNVLVKVGDQVKEGQKVMVMEAMKMENDIAAHVSGTVKEVRVEKGAEVRAGEVLMIIG